MKRVLLSLAIALGLLAGPAAAYTGPNQLTVIGALVGANFNSTADQTITILPQVTKYQIAAITVGNCSTSLTLAAGGFYTGAAKSGTIIVAAAQVYSGLTGATLVLNPTLTAAGSGTLFTTSTVFLSLTTAQGGAATCNALVWGYDWTGY